MTDKVEFLGIPKSFRSVDDVLATAKQLELPNCIVISELEDGRLTFLQTEMSIASANWLLDRLKALLVTPLSFERNTR